MIELTYGNYNISVDIKNLSPHVRYNALFMLGTYMKGGDADRFLDGRENPFDFFVYDNNKDSLTYGEELALPIHYERHEDNVIPEGRSRVIGGRPGTIRPMTAAEIMDRSVNRPVAPPMPTIPTIPTIQTSGDLTPGEIAELIAPRPGISTAVDPVYPFDE